MSDFRIFPTCVYAFFNFGFFFCSFFTPALIFLFKDLVIEDILLFIESLYLLTALLAASSYLRDFVAFFIVSIAVFANALLADFTLLIPFLIPIARPAAI